MLKLTKMTTLVLTLIFGAGILNALVKNENKPEKGEWNFELTQEWVVEKAGEDYLVSPGGFVVDDDGNVYMMERRYTKVFVFDAAGTFKYSFGGLGEGPGEFNNPQIIYNMGRYVIVFDAGARLHYFTKGGKYKNTFRIPSQTYPLDFFDIDSFVMYQYATDRKGNEGLKQYNLKTKKSTLITEFPRPGAMESSKTSEKETVSVTYIDPNTTPEMVIKLKNRHLYIGRNDNYLIKKIDLKGKELLSFSIEGKEPKSVPQAYKEEKIGRIKLDGQKLPKNMANKLMEQMGDHCTLFNTIVVDDKGFIFVYVTDISDKNRQEIDIFSPEGKYLYRSVAVFPDGVQFRSSLRLKGDYIYAYIEDEDEELKFAKYKIKKPLL